MTTKTFINILTYVLLPITMFIAGALIFKRCGKCPEQQTVTVVDTTQHHALVPDTIPKPTTSVKPNITHKPYVKPVIPTDQENNAEFCWMLNEQNSLFIDWQSRIIDSLKSVLGTLNTYNITLQDDSSIYANWKPIVKNNQLQAKGAWTSINRRPTQHNLIQNNATGRLGIGFGPNYYWRKDSTNVRGLSFEFQAQYISNKWWGVEGNVDPFAGYIGGKLLVQFGKANRKVK